VLGAPLNHLDIFTVKGGWYEAENAEKVKAVIGILDGEKTLVEETRKRRRLDEDSP
jgi:hypothetical protein